MKEAESLSDESAAHVERVESLRREAERLVADFDGGVSDAISRVRAHSARQTAASKPQASSLSITDALDLVASERGFDDWHDLQAWHASDNSRLWRRISATRDGRVTDLRGILEALHVTHSQMFATSLSRHFGRPIRSDIGYVDVTTYGELVASLSRPCYAWTFEADCLGAEGCLIVGLPVADRLLADHLGRDSRTNVNSIEEIARQLLDDLRVAYQPVGDVFPTAVRYFDEPRSIGLAHNHDFIYLVGYQVGESTAFSEEKWGVVSLGFPITSVTNLLEQAQAQARRRPSATDGGA